MSLLTLSPPHLAPDGLDPEYLSLRLATYDTTWL